MKNFRNNIRRNRFRKNGSKNMHLKESINKSISDFSSNPNFRPRNQWKNNQNASKLIEKYNNLAREALSNGDKILSENYFQHADHFSRILLDQKVLKNENIGNKINSSNASKEIVKEENPTFVEKKIEN
jgi:phosphorylcholine metabolism protein LicD